MDNGLKMLIYRRGLSQNNEVIIIEMVMVFFGWSCYAYANFTFTAIIIGG